MPSRSRPWHRPVPRRSSVVLGIDQVQTALARPALGSASVAELLDGALLLTGPLRLDPELATAVADADALLRRLCDGRRPLVHLHRAAKRLAVRPLALGDRCRRVRRHRRPRWADPGGWAAQVHPRGGWAGVPGHAAGPAHCVWDHGVRRVRSGRPAGRPVLQPVPVRRGQRSDRRAGRVLRHRDRRRVRRQSRARRSRRPLPVRQLPADQGAGPGGTPRRPVHRAGPDPGLLPRAARPVLVRRRAVVHVVRPGRRGCRGGHRVRQRLRAQPARAGPDGAAGRVGCSGCPPARA